MFRGVRRRVSAGRALAMAVGLNLLGFVGYTGPGASTSLDEYFARAGNLVRRDVAGSFFASIPGFLLFSLVIAAQLRKRGDSRLLGFLSAAIVVVAVLSAVLTGLAGVVELIAAGSQDLDSPDFVVTAPAWVTNLWYPFFLRGLNAFVLTVSLCLIGLIVCAFHDARSSSVGGSAAGRSRFGIDPRVAIVLGIVLFLVGSSMLSFGADRPMDLGEYIAQVGNGIRRDALVSMLLYTPGYVLLFSGIATLLTRRSEGAPALRFLSRAIIVAVVCEVVLDIMWIAVGLVAVGWNDVEASQFMVDAPAWLVNAWFPLFSLGSSAIFVSLGLCLVGLVLSVLREPA